VGCDGCDAWFHSYCARVPDALVEGLDHFSCPHCCLREGKAYAFGGALPPPVLRTMRPTYATAAQLLEQADAESVAFPELEALRALLLAASQWQERVLAAAAALRQPERPFAQAAPDISALPTEAIHQLIKEAMALELTLPEFNSLRFHATRRETIVHALAS